MSVPRQKRNREIENRMAIVACSWRCADGRHQLCRGIRRTVALKDCCCSCHEDKLTRRG